MAHRCRQDRGSGTSHQDLAGDILPSLPANPKARLLDAFDLQILWNKPGQLATVFAEITEAHPPGLPQHPGPRPARIR